MGNRHTICGVKVCENINYLVKENENHQEILPWLKNQKKKLEIRTWKNKSGNRSRIKKKKKKKKSQYCRKEII